jgi:hypothetical protein
MNAMKKIYQLAGMALLVALSACSSSDDWTPGEESVCVNQLYFSSEAPEDELITPNETKSYTLQLSRENSDSEITIPLLKTGSELFQVPESVTFAAGVNSVSVPVTFAGSDKTNTYTCQIAIPEGLYNSPYTSLASYITLSQSVGQWLKLHDVSIYDRDGYVPGHSGALYNLEGTNRYKLENLMKDYDFYFTLSEQKNTYKTNDIIPEGGSWYTSYYWYFGTDTWNSSFKLYLPEDDSVYFDYALLYLSTGYSAVDFENNYGFLNIWAYRYVNGEESTFYPDYEYIYFQWQ